MLLINSKLEKLEVLLVDDDKIFSLLHKKMLKQAGICKPLIYINGKEALEYLDSKSESTGTFLVLLDINMPVMNGWEFLETCEQKDYASKVFVVIVSSSTYAIDLKRARRFKQVISFCEKPLTSKNIQTIMDLKEIKDVCNNAGDKNAVLESNL